MKEVLVAQGLAGGVRPAHEAAHLHHGGLRTEVHDVPYHVGAEQVQNAEFQRLGLLQHEDLAAVVAEAEAYLRMRYGHSREFLDYVPELHVVALQEFPSRGGVIEKVAHREIGAGRGRHGSGLHGAARPHGHLGRSVVVRPAGLQRHLGHGGNAGQRLPAETVGEDIAQVLGGGYLGGRVALEAEHRVRRAHSAAVVDHLDKGPAGIGDHDRNLVRTGVHGIFQQFLDHGSRSLHDLSRGYHVGDLRRKNFQPAHYSIA